MKSITLAVLTVLTAVNAANVTFKVIAPTSQQSVQVDINGQLTTLNAADPDVPYYTGSADLPDAASYKYVVDGTAEGFDRTFEGQESTRNDIYNRPVTYANLPVLPTLLSEGSWSRGAVDHPIWDSNYIPSVFVTANPDEMKTLIETVPKTTHNAKITFIGPDESYTFENCKLSLHRPGRKNNDAKQSWAWALPEGQTFASRSSFKARHQEEDPTQMREKLYADISRKMGTYANEANLIKYYVNKEFMGTFNLLDDVIQYSYIDAMFYNGSPPTERGALYDGGSGATFNPANDYYSFSPNADSPAGVEGIEPFSNTFNSVDFSDDEQVKNIATFFDYDQFLRFMVLEFLTGDWDGYWMEQTNIGAYIDAADNNKMYYLAQDFDATFGVNLADSDTLEMPYTEFPKKYPEGYLINKLLENPGAKATFEKYLTTTVAEIFNNATLGPYVTARQKFIYPDIEADRSVKQRSPGNIFGWTAQQSVDNMFKGVTAPGARSGGAAFGLLEWVAKKENAVRSSLTVPEKSPEASTPANPPPAASSSSTPNNQQQSSSAAPAPQASPSEENDLNAAGISSAASEEELASSAANKNIPQILSAMAVVGLIASLF